MPAAHPALFDMPEKGGPVVLPGQWSVCVALLVRLDRERSVPPRQELLFELRMGLVHSARSGLCRHAELSHSGKGITAIPVGIFQHIQSHELQQSRGSADEFLFRRNLQRSSAQGYSVWAETHFLKGGVAIC